MAVTGTWQAGEAGPVSQAFTGSHTFWSSLPNPAVFDKGSPAVLTGATISKRPATQTDASDTDLHLCLPPSHLTAVLRGGRGGSGFSGRPWNKVGKNRK